MIGVRTPIGQRPHRVRFESPGAPIPDGRGGFRDGTPVVVAELFVEILPARGADQERVAPGTVLSHNACIVNAPYAPEVSTATRMVFNDRSFSVLGVANHDERNAEMTIVCDELRP